jgi:hypothetical protein
MHSTFPCGIQNERQPHAVATLLGVSFLDLGRPANRAAHFFLWIEGRFCVDRSLDRYVGKCSENSEAI